MCTIFDNIQNSFWNAMHNVKKTTNSKKNRYYKTKISTNVSYKNKYYDDMEIFINFINNAHKQVNFLKCCKKRKQFVIKYHKGLKNAKFY